LNLVTFLTAAASAAILCGALASDAIESNPVERLNARIVEGGPLLHPVLHHDGTRRGYLMSLLDALHIDPASQMLVFSKTSLQMDFISPTNPRALFFNDEVSVGFVPNGHLLELATFDPEKGVVFYTLPMSAAEPLKIERKERECASCHSSRAGMAMVVQSVIPMENGYPFISLGTIMPKPVDHRTPFDERWGGWYVTGTHGKMRHMGNSLPRDDFHPFDLMGPQNIVTVPAKVDATVYPKPTSDIVALMVFEHQMYVTNMIARVNRVVRHEPADVGLDEAIEQLVAALFFSGETKITDPIRGSSDFAAHFAARGPMDGEGRSLRQFDLDKRLFRYPFSYMVYSPIFDALPDTIQKRVASRIGQVLKGEGGAAYAHLSAEDRENIRKILLATKPALLN
jgi:hypothetical protein